MKLQQPEFGRRMHSVLSPSETIQNPEFLRGRADQLGDIARAFYAPGRQVFVHGPRGVGKSSLAQTAAYERQSADGDPVIILCTEGNTCYEIVKQIAEKALPSDPRTIKKIFESSGSVGIKSISVSAREQIVQGSIPLPTSLTDSAQLLELIVAFHSERPVIIVDEFDQISDKDQQLVFANLIKLIGDTHIDIDIIFCGIGDSIDDLFAAHPSAHRYFHAVLLGRLDMQSRVDIIDVAAAKLGVIIDDTSKYRIATVSDGFPHFVHLICEKLFWGAYLANDGMRVTPDLFEKALTEAVTAIAPELKKPYEKATRKYTNDCEPILWAVADSDKLERPSREIFESYERIMSSLNQAPIKRATFNNRMNALKRESHGKILTGSRQGWYEYTEKIHRGYARLRALQNAVQLEREHPLQVRRYGGLLNAIAEAESLGKRMY